MPRCLRCGECCFNNGLIPPLLPTERAPQWFHTLVENLRDAFSKNAEDYHCLFLKGDFRCALHGTALKPRSCRDFAPGDCPGYRSEETWSKEKAAVPEGRRPV